MISFDQINSSIYQALQSQSNNNLQIIPLINSSRTMQIFVKTLTGKMISFDVESSDDIFKIKTQVAEKVDLPADHQILVYEGKRLENEMSLEDLGIGEDSTLHKCRCGGG